jgi:hypothetical protein
MGQHEEAERAYSIALRYHKDYDQAWLGWGRYWDMQARLNTHLATHMKVPFHDSMPSLCS